MEMSSTYDNRYSPPAVAADDNELQLLANQAQKQFNDRSNTWGRRGVVLVSVFLSFAILSRVAVDHSNLPYEEANMMSGDPMKNFDKLGRYRMRHYDQSKPMASFLAGIGGLWGVPMWAYYVNRGQGIACFGVENKDNSIMKFNTADRAYQVTPYDGFRTLLKGHRSDGSTFNHQPFMPEANVLTTAERNMYIGMNEMEIEEVDEERNLKTNALYFTVPNTDYPAIVRRVTFENLDQHQSLDLEVVDGLAKLEPAGVSEGQLDAMGRTMEGWMRVYNFDEMNMPFFHLSTSPADTAEVQIITEGQFAMAFVEDEEGAGDHELLPFIVDERLVFGRDTSLTSANPFFTEGVTVADLLQQPQGLASRTPAAFAATSLHIPAGGKKTISIVYGHTPDLKTFTDSVAPQILSRGYVTSKYAEAQDLTKFLTTKVTTKTGDAIFDNYVGMNFLDNLLRGGLPIPMGDKENPKIYHTFSRIHGDLERDYNNFQLDLTYFSQGPGNFRDVNQNRRMDVSQNAQVKDFNVRTFLSYVQSDGYNQMTVETAFFSVTDHTLIPALVGKIAGSAADLGALSAILQKPFRPGNFFADAAAQGIKFKLPKEDVLNLVAAAATQTPSGQFAQNGYWTDHWTYDLDLINNYLSIYPEQREFMLWDSDPLPFFITPGIVRPRHQKYMKTPANTIRQYDAIMSGDTLPTAKTTAMENIWSSPDFVGDASGGGMWQRDATGVIFRVPIITKIMVLAIMKFSILDPGGMGVEMEAGKPGWNDAMNGLPGLIGSEMPSACELYQILDFLGTAIDEHQRSVSLPKEVSLLLKAIQEAMVKWNAKTISDFEYWDQVHDFLELYREKTAITFEGGMEEWSAAAIGKASGVIGQMMAKQQKGFTKALTFSQGGIIMPTYFRYEATEYTELGPAPSQPTMQAVRVSKFDTVVLPYFTEGPVRHLKTIHDPVQRRAIYDAMQTSKLHDTELKMWKISENLHGQPFEIGRMMAFEPGWLENESIWLHMQYKFYLELLRGGLYEEFFEQIKTGVVCFMDPEVLGRSPLEADSFIVSSAFPEKAMHGSGFLARLSGSTAEFLSMWNHMMTGPTPFITNGGRLELALKPILPDWLWADDGTIMFTFLGNVAVTYHNPAKSNTFGPAAPTVFKIVLTSTDESKPAVTLTTETIPEPYASAVRSGAYSKIDVFYQ